MLSARIGALTALLALGCAPEPELRSALVVSFDTTRADSAFDPKTAPTLDSLARESLRYDNARTVAPLTLPSHSSLLTGLVPPRHGVRDNNVMRLSGSASTLAERARQAGMQTAAFVAAVVLDESFGLAQGFDVYDQPALPTSDASSLYTERSADKVADAALEWLTKRDTTRPFLLWMHVFDPHDPYAPEERFLEQAGGDPYKGEIAQADAALGRVLDALRADGSLDTTIVVVVADHGEALGEHDEDTHSAYCFDSTIRVPLYLRYPDGHRAGERSNEVVSIVDIFPTLTEGMGLGRPGDVDGVSLWKRSVPAGRGVYFETYSGYLNYGWSPIAGWADARGKYLHAPTPLFFETDTDPGELRDVAAEHDTEPYRRAIAAIHKKRPLAPDDPDDADVSPEAIDSLRKLGYAGSGAATEALPHPLENSGRPDPHERTDELRTFNRAIALREQGQVDVAIPLLEGILRENPENAYALEFLAGCYAQTRRFQEAVPLLKKLLELGVDTRTVHYNLGGCLETLGRVPRAIQHYRRAAELDPRHVPTLRRLVALLEKRKPAEAARYARLLAAAKPE